MKKKKENCFEKCDENLSIEKSMLILEWSKGKRKVRGCINFLAIVFPNGKRGYRIEIGGEDMGTIYYNEKNKCFEITQF